MLDKEVELIRAAISIGSPGNPFLKDYQFRNKLIFELLLETGIRLGELLKLKVNDFARIEDNYYMKIDNYTSDIEDNRSELPSNKNTNSFRTVAVSQGIYNMAHQYVVKHRRFLKRTQKMNLDHSYLFVSELGNPMSIRSVQQIFEKIKRHVKSSNSKYKGFKVTAHSLRHTFAFRFLKFLTEAGVDLERAQDELRTIGGWNVSSAMPVRYARRYIRDLANDHNLRRLNQAYQNNYK